MFATRLRHGKLGMFGMNVFFGLGMLDALAGQTLKTAFADLHPVVLALCLFGLYTLIEQSAINALVERFYAYGGKVWTRGGREQFAHAGGYSVQVYVSLAVSTLAVFFLQWLAQRGISIIPRIAILLPCMLITHRACRILGRVIFSRYSPTVPHEEIKDD